MHPNCFSISSPLALFLFLSAFIRIPTTLRADDPLYSDCSTTITCGSIANIGYPFWGVNRANYCGQPGFDLKCEDDVAKITMGQNTLRILDVNPRLQILKVAREDYWNGYCPAELINTTISFNHFDYGSSLRNLTLFYGCLSPISSVLTFPITNCTIDGKIMDVSYAVTSVLIDLRPEACHASVIVPIYEAAAQNLEGNPSTINDALRGGFELQWDVDSDQCRRCSDSDGVCGYNQTTNSFICFCRDQPSETTCPPTQGENRNGVGLVVGLGIAGAVITGMVLGILIIRFRQGRKKIAVQANSGDLPTPPLSSKEPPTSTTNLSQSIPSYSTSTCDLEKRSTYFGAHVFSYEELKEATDNFNPSKKLGEGGFGSVYYGVLNDGRAVAVKLLYESNFNRVDQYMNEIAILTRIRHPNLVTLYGCTSRRSRELLLVYEYIPNGTVEDHLQGKLSNSSLLTWPVRLSVAVETAKALAYLHETDIIHRDIKSNNILLDNNFHVKVADFGLSRLFPDNVTHVSTAPQGTPGYVDPEYYQCYRLTEKSDVYSFGVVLVELISAKQAVDTNRHRHDINLANMAVSRIQNHALHELVDPSLGFENDYAVKSTMTAVAELAFRCLQQERDVRPSMKEVMESLREIQNEELGVGIRSEAEVQDIRSSDDVGLLKHIIPPLSPDKWLQVRSM